MDNNNVSIDCDVPEEVLMNILGEVSLDALPILKVDKENESDSPAHLVDYSNLEALLILDSENVTEQNWINPKGGTSKGERRFVCPECSKPFKLKRYLIKHIRIHTEKRPYTCKICGNAFSVLSKLKTHVQINHTEYYPKSYLVGGSVYSNPRYVRDGYRYIPPGQMTAMVVGDTVATNSFSGGPFQPSRAVVVPFDGLPEIQEDQHSELVTEKQQQQQPFPAAAAPSVEPDSLNEFNENEQSPPKPNESNNNDEEEPESLDVLENTGTTENVIVSTAKAIAKGPVKKVKISKSKKTPTTPLPVETEEDEEEDDDELSAVWPFGGGATGRRGSALPAYNAFFPIFIGGPSSSGRSRTRSAELENGYPGSATAIANSFSTGKGGVATSHATSFGDPYAAAMFRNAGLYNFKTKSFKKQQQHTVYDD